MEGQNHKRRNLEKNGTSKSRRRSPDQEKKLGPTRRKPTSSVVRHALKWNPQGKRKRGRPRSTWRRSVETEGRPLGHSRGQLEVLSETGPSGGSLWSTYAPQVKGISQVKYLLAYRVRDNPRGVLKCLTR